MLFFDTGKNCFFKKKTGGGKNTNSVLDYSPLLNMHLQPKSLEVIKYELCAQCELLSILKHKGAIVNVEQVEQL